MILNRNRTMIVTVRTKVVYLLLLNLHYYRNTARNTTHYTYMRSMGKAEGLIVDQVIGRNL